MILAIFEFFEIVWKRRNDQRSDEKMYPQIEELKAIIERLQAENLRVPRQLRTLYWNLVFPRQKMRTA